ncbi:MAG TPA: CapA family protein [Candidatus Macondimonas sp.]|nr:CapA family protein [Candidatus Macondimonas sp.]
MNASPHPAITLLLCGDVMTGRGIDQILPHPGRPEIFEPYLRSAVDYVDLAEAVHGPIARTADFTAPWGDALAILDQIKPDVRIANLETAVTTSDRPWPGKDVHYRMLPANLPCLTGFGMDVCTLANNHVLDWCHTGLIETLDELRNAGVRTAGAGRDVREAWLPAGVDVAGKGRILVFAFGCASSGIPAAWAAGKNTPGIAWVADLSKRTVEEIAARIEPLRQAGDVVIASIHWGGNWGYAIPASHRAFAHGLIDMAGVDVIHGHSSHHPMGLEVYRGRPVFYGCGDLVNDYEGIAGFEDFHPELALLYLVTLTEGGLHRLELVPLQRLRFCLRRATQAQAPWLRQKLATESIGLDRQLTIDAQGHLHCSGFT